LKNFAGKLFISPDEPPEETKKAFDRIKCRAKRRALRRHHLIGDGAPEVYRVGGGGAPTRKVGVGGAKMKSAAAASGGACGLVFSQTLSII